MFSPHRPPSSWLADSLGNGEDIITYLSLQCVNVKEAIDALSSFNHVNVEELIPCFKRSEYATLYSGTTKRKSDPIPRCLLL